MVLVSGIEFRIIFHYRLLQDIDYRSLCCIANLWCLSINITTSSCPVTPDAPATQDSLQLPEFLSSWWPSLCIPSPHPHSPVSGGRHNSVTERCESFTWIPQIWWRETEQLDNTCQHLPAHLHLRTPSPHLPWAESLSPGPCPRGPRELACEGVHPSGRVGQGARGRGKVEVAGLLVHSWVLCPAHFLCHFAYYLSPSSGRVEVCHVHGVTTALRPPLSAHRKHCLAPAWRVYQPAKSKPTDRAWSAWELRDL